jgi:RNA polymerase sigma factor (sigma-70 family)
MGKFVPTDAELVAQALAGNREAFGELYDRHARAVRAVVAAVSADWPAVDDLVQECFLRAYRNLPKLRDPARFGPWLVGTARQVGRERRRSLARDRHEFQDPSKTEIESEPNSEVCADDRDQLDLVMRQVAMLPEQERLAIHAFFFERRSADGAAQLLGLSRSGFYAIVQRAIARLSKQMQPSVAEREKL